MDNSVYTTFPKKISLEGKTFIIKDAIIKIPSSGGDDSSSNPKTYIKYGYLLSQIQSRLLLYDRDIPCLRFNIDFENLESDENYILTYEGSISSDPRICLTLKELNLPNHFTTSDIFQGRLFNLYLNIDWLSNITSENINNNKDSFTILEFLKTINAGITESLGGINDISIQVDRNKINFIEKTPKENKTPDPEYSIFNIYGIKESNSSLEGSFIRKINLSSEIPNDMKALAVIGAQSNSNQVGGNALSFSNYSKGLIDRIIPEKINYSEAPGTQDTSKKTPLKTEKTLKNLISKTYLLHDGGGIHFNDENIDSLKSNYQEYSQYKIGELSTPGPSQQIAGPFFLPFNLSLDLDGLAGIKLYQKFKMSDSVLPKSYDSKEIDIIVSSVSHKVDSSSWITSIDTLATPSFTKGKLPPISPLMSNINPKASIRENNLLPTSENSDLYKIVPSLPSALFSQNRRDAMQKSYNFVFKRDGEKKGWCARWTYNMAYNYVRFLKDQFPPMTQIPSGGAANQNLEYWSNLTKIGYTQHKIGTNISKERLAALINPPYYYEYGDVVVYYANDGEGSHRELGHTQICVGDINPVQWSSSLRLNYGAEFIYGSTDSNFWDFYIFKAPST